MTMTTRRASAIFYALMIAFLLTALPLSAQTFRGGINGTVTDSTGAVVPRASVVATNVDTGITHTTTSSSGGEFLFQDLPLGSYSVVVSISGFSTAKFAKVTVSAGTTYTAGEAGYGLSDRDRGGGRGRGGVGYDLSDADDEPVERSGE